MGGKFLVTDKVPAGFTKELEKLGFEVDYREFISNEDLGKIIPELTGIVVNTSLLLTAAVLEKAARLKYILRPGSGLDNIDLEAAKKQGIRVYSSPEANADAVGEHAAGLLLALLNHIPNAWQQVKNGEWKRAENTGNEIKGKTIGIIGYGNTGSAFARKLSGFGADILVYDKYKTGFGNEWAKEVSLEILQERADIISLHVPLNNETRHYVNDGFIGRMQKPFYLINTSRGKVADTAAVIRGLESGIIRGAALDVLENENVKGFNDDEKKQFDRLISFDNVIITPHIAGWTEEARANIFWVVLEKFRKDLEG